MTCERAGTRSSLIQAQQTGPLSHHGQYAAWVLLIVAALLLCLGTVAADHAGLVAEPDAVAGPNSKGVGHVITVENPETGSKNHPISVVRFAVPAELRPTLQFLVNDSSSQGSDGSAWSVASGTDANQHWLEFAAAMLSDPLSPGDRQDFRLGYHVTGSPLHGAQIPIEIEGSYLGTMTMEGQVQVIIDAEPPQVANASAHDLAGDGYIDAYHVNFSKAVNADTLVPEDWSMPGRIAASLSNQTGLVDSTWIKFTRTIEFVAGKSPDAMQLPSPPAHNEARQAPNTGNPPPLSYEGSSLEDGYGNVQSTASGFPVFDRAPPVPIHAVTRDTSGNGCADRVDIEFSEPVEGTLVDDEWQVDASNQEAMAATFTQQNRGSTIHVNLPACTTVPATGFTPEISYSPGLLEDASGNPVTGFSIWPADGVPPRILRSTTLDRDADGIIDGLRVEFSEPMTASGNEDIWFPEFSGMGVGSPRTGAPSSHWKVADFDAIEWVGVSGDSVWLMQLEPGKIPDSDVVPAISFDPESTTSGDTFHLHDLYNNALEPLAELTSIDGAGPVLLRADGQVGSNIVTLWFSEPVVGQGSGTVAAQDFRYIDSSGSGATKVSSIAGGAGTARIKVRLDVALSADEVDVDSISAINLRDAAGNPAAGQALIHVDSTAPGKVTDLQATPSSRNTVHLEWTTPPTFDVDTVVIRFSDEAFTARSGREDMASATLKATPGQRQTTTLTGLDPGTEYHVILHVLDHAGNQGRASNDVTVTTPLDTTPPFGELKVASASHPVAGKAYQNNTPAFTWNTLADDESPVHYFVAITNSTGSVQPSAANVTQATAWITNETIPDGVWYFHVRAASHGGPAPAGAYYEFVIDTTPPATIDDLAVTALTTMANLTWTAPGDDNADGISYAYSIHISTNEIIGQDWSKAQELSHDVIPADAGAQELFSVTGLTASTDYWVGLYAIDDAGNQGAWSNPVAFTTSNDTTPPAGLLRVTSDTHQLGEASDAATLEFNWTAVVDMESPVQYYHALTNKRAYAVSSQDNVTSNLAGNYTDLDEGDWYVHVRAHSSGGWGNQSTYHVIVLRLNESEIAASNSGIKLRAVVKGDIVVVRWQLPPETQQPATPAGVQLWSIQGQAVSLIEDIPALSVKYEERKVEFERTPPMEYAVTAYYGKTSGLGYFAPGSGPDTRELQLTGIERQSEVGPFWILIAAAVAGALAVPAATSAMRMSNRSPHKTPGPSHSMHGREAPTKGHTNIKASGGPQAMAPKSAAP